MTHGIWIHVDRVDVMKVKFDVHKLNVQLPNVDQMKHLLNRLVNAVDDVKKVCDFLKSTEISKHFHNK